MSASEIIEQIKALPREEWQRVAEFVHTVERNEAANEPSVRYADDAEFDAVVDRVLDKHAELFKKLAE